MTNDRLTDDEVFDEDSIDEDVEELEKFIETKGVDKKNTSLSRARIEVMLEERRLRKELEEFDFDDLDD